MSNERELRPPSASEVEAEAERCRIILDTKAADGGSDLLFGAYNALLFVLGYGVAPPSEHFHGKKWMTEKSEQ